MGSSAAATRTRAAEQARTGCWPTRRAFRAFRRWVETVTERVVALTLSEPHVAHWTAGAIAAGCAISVSSVHRIWRGHGLRPHQIWGFKLSSDPQFATKVRDIVGFYVNPPEHAVVLSVDKS
jgi:hypothetical protein